MKMDKRANIGSGVTPTQAHVSIADVNYDDLRPEQLRMLTMLPTANVIESPEVQKQVKKFLTELEQTRGGLRDKSWEKLESKWALFVSFCFRHNQQPLPVKHDILMQYLSERSVLVHRNTLKSDVWAINTIHFNAGFSKPCNDPAVKALIKNVSEKQVQQGTGIKQATPLTLDDLKLLSSVYSKSNCLRDTRDLAMIGMAFSCLLRGSELSRIKLGHVDFTRSKLTIPFTKTNHSGINDVAPISKMALDWLKRFLSLANFDLSDKEQFVFRRMTPKMTLHRDRREHIGKDALSSCYKRAFEVAQSNHVNEPAFSTHSTRVGSCQALWSAGVELGEIMKLGRWSTESIAYQYGRGFEPNTDTVNDVLSF